MKSIFLLLLALFQFVYSYAQEDNKSQFLTEKLDSYFKLKRELISLQLNKDTFLRGEEIWYKGYVYNLLDSTSNLQTTNVNIYMYNDKGKVMLKKLDLSKDGYFHGSILVDSIFNGGDYYIRAFSNFMRNFNEDNSYIKKIKVIENEVVEKVNKCKLVVKPEGGSLIENVLSSIGYMLDCNQLNRLITKSKGFIINDLGDTVATSYANKWGLGKVKITPRKNRKYKIIFNLSNDNKVESEYFDSMKKGVIMNVNNNHPELLKLQLKTNLASIDSISNIFYKLVVHKDGQSMVTDVNIPIHRNDLEINIKKSELFKGVNILSLLDQKNKLVSERIIFNEFGLQNYQTNVSSIVKDGDSLEIRLATPSFFANNSQINISALPSNNKSYDVNDNMLLNYYIKPYVNSTSTIAGAFLSKIDRQNKYNLDNFLITAGKSRFDWSNILNYRHVVKNEFENGIRFDLKINSNKIKKLLLHSTKNFPQQLLNVKEPVITIDRFYPYENEQLKISSLDSRGMITESLISVIQKTSFEDIDFSSISEVLIEKDVADSVKIIESKNNKSKIKLFDDSVEKLEEVIVKGKALKNDRNGISIDEDIDISSNFIKNKTVKITRAEIDMYNTVLDYIKSKGFWVGKTRDQRTFIRTNASITINGNHNTLVYFNDIEINVSIDNFLDGMLLSQVEKILVDKSGFGYGARGAAGVIKIYSRITPLNDRGKKLKKFVKYVKFEPSFSFPKKFYRPEYYSESNNLFESYGVIHWVPNARVVEGDLVLKIKMPEVSEITFYIDGLLQGNKPISIAKNIDLGNYSFN